MPSRMRSPAAGAALALLIPAVVLGAIGDTLSSFPAPCGAPTGLSYANGRLWLADWETGKLYEIASETGTVLRALDAPCFRPEGLAFDGKVLYIADYETHRIFAFDPDAGLTLWSYEAPESAPRGLAFGGGSLWLLDDGADTIYEVVPEDGTIRNYYKSPHDYGRGLAHDGEHLWAVDRRLDELYALRPSDGKVLFLAKAPGRFPCGLAFGDGFLWLSDFETKRIYKLSADADVPYRVTGEILRDFRFRYLLRNDGQGTVTEAAIHVAVPYDSLENQWIVRPVKWTPEPERFAVDRCGQRIAVFPFRNVPAGKTVSAGYETRVRLGELHYAFFPEDVGGLEAIPKEIREKGTAPKSRLQLDEELVRKTAAEVVGGEKNPYWIARNLFDWVIGKLSYDRVGGWDVPTTLIKRGTGSCSEYAFLYIALARSAGLPARYEGSVVVRGDDASIDDVYHRWCEVFLPGIGWMPVDPSGGDQEWPADQVRYFGGLADRFLITTHGGGDSEYLGWDYNAHATYVYEGRGTVHEEGYGIWSPAAGE
ncbi:MAG: transglutaminase domain-containing protein [Candidatus Eisenbacteria bacterium]